MGESMGKLFSGLTKTEVQNDGKSVLYNSPASAGMAIADAVRKTAEPATSNVQGELTPPVSGRQILPGPVDASVPDISPSGDNTSVSMNQPAIAAPPMMKKTSFGEAASTSPNKLTTKGTVLRLLLESGLGAAAGAGSRTVGEGSARALQAQKARSDLVTQANEQEQQRANLADLPGDKARAVAHQEAVTALAQAQKEQLDQVPFEGTMVSRKSIPGLLKDKADNESKADLADRKGILTNGYTDAFMQFRKDHPGEDPTKDPGLVQWQQAIGMLKPEKPLGDSGRAIQIFSQMNAKRQLSDDDANWIAGYIKNNDLTKIEPGVLRARELVNNRFFNGALDGQAAMLNGPMINKIIAQGGTVTPAQFSPEVSAQVALGKGEAPTKVGDQVMAYGTLLRHIKDLRSSYQTINNLDARWANKPLNEIAVNSSAAPELRKAAVKAQAVKAEIMRVLNGPYALQEEDRKAAQELLSINDAPAAGLAATEQMAHTGADRLASLNDQVRNVTGKDQPNLLAPDNAEFLKSLGVYIKGYGASPKAAGKISVTDPNGGVHTFPDQKSATAFKKAAGIK